VSTIDQAVFIS